MSVPQFTVARLIEVLSAMPAGAKVAILDADTGWSLPLLDDPENDGAYRDHVSLIDGDVRFSAHYSDERPSA